MRIDSTNTNELYAEIHRLQKLIHGADVPYWLNDRTIFQYRSGVVDGWINKLDQLLDLDLQQRPHVLRGSP